MKIAKNKNVKWWVGTVLCTALFLAIGLFSYYKMDFLWKGVQITASIDRDDTSPLIEIKGNAKNATYLSLNGREIFINKEGEFSEKVALLPGLSVVTIDAQDKFGKSAEKKFEVMYEESTGAVALGDIIINTN
jgi:hypothetical protein